MEYKIYYGEKGSGKTSYFYSCFENREDSIYISGEIERNNLSYPVIFDLLRINSCEKSIVYEKLQSHLRHYNTLIIDSVQLFDKDEFTFTINAARNASIKKVILIFDLAKNLLITSPNFHILIDNGMPYSTKIIEYKCSKQVIKKWIKKNYNTVDKSEYEKILTITNNNFLNISNLMWYKKCFDNDSHIISREVLLAYVNKRIENIFSDLPNELLFTLKKSSVIGFEFEKQILTSYDGFNIFEVANYLKQLEDMHIFIISNLKDKNYYRFVSKDMHQAIFDGIDPNDKKLWIEILIKYFTKFKHKATSCFERINIFYKLKNLYELLNDKNNLIIYDMLLLKEYTNCKDYHKSIAIAKDCFNLIDDNEFYGLKQFIFLYLIENYKKFGQYQTLLELLSESDIKLFYSGSLLYIDYYRALSSYNLGKIDDAYDIICKLVKTIQPSAINYSDQPLYSLVYSLASTIQHHLHLDDDGLNYYKLALNHSLNKLSDKDIYYDILKKCGMFFDYKSIKHYLNNCIDYFKNNDDNESLAEVYLNLGTEIMFQEGDPNGITGQLLSNAESIFNKFPNEQFAYVKNNIAIYHLLIKNDISMAILKLKEALILGLSDFTYMTIYLNLCICLLMKKDYDSKEYNNYYKHFCKYVKTLKNRKHETKYEAVYKDLFDLIAKEHVGESSNIIKKCDALLKKDSLDMFFKCIITDIKYRNSNDGKIQIYNDNNFFYESLNTKKIFLAEFRFWE